MKKTGLIAILILALMSCNGNANDGDASTDTTTFPSEMAPDTSNTGLGGGRDSSDRAPSSIGNPSSTNKTTTPGNANGREDSNMTNSSMNQH